MKNKKLIAKIQRNRAKLKSLGIDVNMHMSHMYQDKKGLVYLPLNTGTILVGLSETYKA